jgi:hypothetical protein
MAKRYKKRYENNTEEKLEERRQQRLSSSVEEKPFSLEEYGRDLLGKKFGMDTFEDDLQKMTNTVNSISSDWQTQETMQNTKSSVQSMMKRMDAYQSYQKRYGGEDLSELYDGYRQVLRNWDDLSEMYAGFETADAFNTARTKSVMDKKFSGLTYEEVQEQLKQYDKESDEYKYLSEYMGYTNLKDYDKALEASRNSLMNTAKLTVGEMKNGLKDNPNFSSENAKSIIANMNTVSTQKEYIDKLKTVRNQYALDHKFDLYEHYLNAEDFDFKSRYIEADYNGLWDRLSNAGKDVYEYVGYLSTLPEGARSSAYRHGFAGFGSMPEGIENMTDEEMKTFFYIANQEGYDKGLEFIKDMEVTLSKRGTDARNQKQQERLESGGDFERRLKQGVMSIASVPVGLVGKLEGATDDLTNILTGDEINPYSYRHSRMNSAQNVQEVTRENIDEFTKENEWIGTDMPIIGNAWTFGYNTALSVGESATGIGTVGKAYSALAGIGAFSTRAKELKEEGATDEQIIYGSLASGTMEWLGEHIGIDNLFKIKNADSLKNILKSVGSQMIAEAGEEAFTEIGNIAIDMVNRGTFSDAYQMYQGYIDRGFSEGEAWSKTLDDLGTQVASAGIGGALSGGVMGGTYSTVQYSDFSNTGKQIRENDRVTEMMEFEGLTPKESDTYKLYSEYAKKGINADNISNARLGNLYQTAKIENDSIKESKKTTTEQKADAINRLDRLGVVTTSKTDEERSIQQRAESLKKGEATKVTATGNSTKIEGIKIEEGKTLVKTGEGEFGVDEMTFSENDAKIIAQAENAGEEKGNLMLTLYDGKADVSSFVNSFNLAYSYGEIGMGVDSALKNKGVLNEGQAYVIYKTAMTNKSIERQRVIDEINEKHFSNVFVQGNFDDSIIDYDGTVTDGSKVAWKDLTKTQRNAISFAKGFSKATGVNITFINSEVEDGKRVGENGRYNPADNTIYIDVYAGIIDAKTVKDSIIPTLSHEMTHWMKAKSPAMYDKIREHALETLAMSGNISSNERIAYEMKRMEKAHKGVKVTEEMAIDEIVARYCEDMLANSNKARKLLNQMNKKEQQSFIAKVKDTFNNLMEWVNELLSQYKSSSKEAEILREYKHRLKEVSKMWDMALEEAIKSNQSLQAEGITGEQLIGENILAENTAQFSIRTYENEGRDLLHKWLENSDLSKKDKKNIIEQMDYVYDVATKYAQENDLVDFSSWSDTDIIRRDDGTPILTVVVPNGEYPLNIDFSQICKKRKALNAVLNALVRSGDLDIRTLSQSDIGNINRIIKEHGFEIACALCFVDSKRYRVNEWADSFADTFNKLVKSLTKGTDFKVDEYNYTGRNVKQPEGKLLKDADDSELNFDYINEVLAKNSSGKAIYRYALAIKNNKELRSVLNSSEIISSAGLDAIKVQNELLYGLVNSHQGSAKPKLSHSENPYGYEILLDARFNAEDAYKVGGVRIQSFSDYMANMFFDYVQMIGDLSAKKLPAHAYTKEYYFAKLFGLTGIKINMSIVPKGADITDEQKARFNKMTKAMKEKDAEFKALKSHAGLDANGNYILEDETFPLDKALEIQNTKGYDANCGIIWVGVSNAHINKMLDDENVPFIIPYHKSSLNPAIARMRNIDFYNDYTKAQNTRYDSKAKKKVPASVWSFDFYADLAKTNDPKQTAENYKTECKNRGYLPKFDEFANHPNYYKLLVDFRVYDANGNYAPQSAVKMEFPSDFNEIVGESLVEAQDTQNKLDADMKGLLDEIRSELKLGTQNQQEQYADRDIDSQLSEIRSEMQNLQSEMFELEKNEEFQNAKTNLAFAESFKEKAEARKTLKEIKDRLGYNDLVERKAELDAKRIELIKQKEAQKEPFRVRILEDSDYARLKKHFGTTSNFTVAGYMLKDGTMLDFSGKHWGDSSSTMRTVDHRDVKEVFEDTNNSGAEEMINMISNGNIRLMAETGGINLAVAPTSDQLRVLERYINSFRGEVVVDIDKVGGDTIKSFTYDRGTSAKKILDDIDNYFRGGRQSELMMFHTMYSDRVEYVDDVGTWMSSHAWKDVIRVASENVRGEAKIVNKARCGDFIIPSGNELVYTRLNKRNSEDVEIHQIINVEVQEESDLEDTNLQFVFERFVKEYENGKYENTSIEEYGKFVRRYVEKMLGREVNITIYTRPDYQSNRKNGLVRKEETSRRLNFHFGDEQDGRGSSAEGEQIVKRYSDRDNVSVYDAMGETESLKKQNEILKLDIERLKERLKLERQVTNGNMFNEKQLIAVAKHLRNLVKSEYSETALVDELRDVYSYIIENPQLEWDVLMAKSYDVARRMLDSSKGVKVTNDYFKSVLGDIRKTRIKLNSEQMQEAKNVFGDKYRDSFMGRVILAKDGVSLDQQWQEWSEKYPEIFDSEVTGADQITALHDIYTALREGSEMYQKYNDEEGIRSLATEIYNQYWNVSTIRTTADKYDKQIKRINYEHRKAMGELRDGYKKRVQDQKTADAIHYGKVISNLRHQRDERVKEARQYGKMRLEEQKERIAKKHKIEKITKNTKLLREWLGKNTKDKHISDELKEPVRDLLVAIDFASRNTGIDTAEQTKALAQISKNVEEAKAKVDLRANLTALQISSAKSEELQRLGVDFSSEIEALTKSISSLGLKSDALFVLKDMSLDDLVALDKIVTTLKTVITRANQYYTMRRKQSITASAHELFALFESLGDMEEGNFDGLKNFFNYENVLPIHFFDRLGEVGQDLFHSFVKAQDKMAFLKKEVQDFADRTWTSKELQKWDSDLIEFEVVDAKKTTDVTKPVMKKVYTTTSRLMNLYLQDQREQSKEHLYKGGGGRFTTFKHKGKTYGEDVNGVVLSPQLVQYMLTKLDPRAKEVADAISKFLNGECKEWGNEITMDLYGTELFVEPKYIPIEVIAESVSRQMEKPNRSITALLNKGFTKETKPNAKNQIVLDSIFGVFAKHTSEMMAYNAFAREVYDAVRLFEYNENRQTYVYDDEKGQTVSDNIQTAMRGSLGKGAVTYFRNFLEDINGSQQAGRGDNMLSKAFSNSKLANVAWNMNVALLQPLSLVRAMTMINPVHLSKGIFGIPSGIKNAMKYSGTALWKSYGFYDTDISKGLAEQIKNNKTFGDKLKEWSMKAPEVMDRITWGALWTACEYQVLAENKALRKGSDEFYSKVVELFEETVYRTQVMDSVLSRSQITRSKSGLVKGLTSYMAEPLVTYNMVYGIYSQWNLHSRSGHSFAECRKKFGKALAIAVGVYGLSALAEAGIRTLTTAMRNAGGDDEEEEKDENVFLEQLLENLNPLSKFPIGREISSALQGYGVSSINGLDTIEAFTNAFKTISKMIVEGDEISYKKVHKILKAVSYGTGHGVSNAYRDTVAIWNSTIGKAYPSLIVNTDE